MSSKGIFSSLSGALAQSERLDTIANNIANSNTAAFKKERQVFSEYLTANEKPPTVMTVPRIPASEESFYDMQGGDRAYVDASGTYVDHSQGALKNTNGPLDLAIEGRGYFEVLAPGGVRLSRNGNLKIDAQGRLVTREGFPVLREGLGQDPEQRTIRLSGARDVTVSYSGEIYEAGQMVGRLSMVDVADQDALQKQGSSLYALKDNYGAQLKPASDFKVHQGFIELSNVNIVDEMTDMIMATRAFETNKQAISTFDKMDEKLVNDVPKTS